MAQQLGIAFIPQLIGLGDDLPDVSLPESLEARKRRWLPANPAYVKECYRGSYRLPLFPEPCPLLFTTLAVKPDGRVAPCCLVTAAEHAFGDLLAESLEEIWNNAAFVAARNLFVSKKREGYDRATICARCHNFKKAP